MSRPAIESGPRVAWRRRLHVGATAALLLAAAACQQKMAREPYFRPLEETDFFPDGRASRPLEPGTVMFREPAPDNALLTGLTELGMKPEPQKEPNKDDPKPAVIPVGAPNDPKKFVDVFPFKMTESDLRRGQERYTIYCTPCHSPLGDGNGKIVERGNLKPTSYLGENSRGFGRYRIDLPLKDAPVGYYFEVISKGFGGMPDYAMQVQPADRWRIIAYIRALQLSQSASLKELPAAVREAANKAADESASPKEKAGGNHQ
jgi:hypothetical protein